MNGDTKNEPPAEPIDLSIERKRRRPEPKPLSLTKRLALAHLNREDLLAAVSRGVFTAEQVAAEIERRDNAKHGDRH